MVGQDAGVHDGDRHVLPGGLGPGARGVDAVLLIAHAPLVAEVLVVGRARAGVERRHLQLGLRGLHGVGGGEGVDEGLRLLRGERVAQFDGGQTPHVDGGLLDGDGGLVGGRLERVLVLLGQGADDVDAVSVDGVDELGGLGALRPGDDEAVRGGGRGARGGARGGRGIGILGTARRGGRGTGRGGAGAEGAGEGEGAEEREDR